MRIVESYLQYQNAPKLNALIDSMQDILLIPVAEFYDKFYNILTCDAQGLDNWGLILKRNRTYYYYNYNRVFGFKNNAINTSSIAYPQNFGHGNFFSSSTNLAKGTLTDFQYRLVLLLTYQKYCVDCSVETCTDVVNSFIQLLYDDPSYNCTIIESDRHFTYAFNYKLSTVERSIFNNNKELPKPAGIGYSVTWIG